MTLSRGLTLVETVVGVAISLIVILGTYAAYQAVFASLQTARVKIAAADLINEQFEIIRNLPYNDVGIIGGNPSGKIQASQNLNRSNINWIVESAIENIDDPFDGLGASDPKPNDYKLVEVKVSCPTCKNFTPIAISGYVAPRDLEP